MELNNIPWEHISMFIPLIIISAVGFYFKNNPTKKINTLVGYRTKRSMSSQEAWDFAQVYSSGLLFTWSLAGMIGLAMQLFYQKDTSATSFAITSMVVMLAIIIGVVYFTEKELKKNFE